jgi:hypothetical protein
VPDAKTTNVAGPTREYGGGGERVIFTLRATYASSASHVAGTWAQLRTLLERTPPTSSL